MSRTRFYVMLGVLLAAGAFWFGRHHIARRNTDVGASRLIATPDPFNPATTANSTTPSFARAATNVMAVSPPPSTGPASTNGLPLASAVAAPSVQLNAPRKRAWDADFLSTFKQSSSGGPIRFKLVAGRWATGTLQRVERRGGEIIYLSGKLSAPEAGRFFFQLQSLPGKAGDFTGVVEFPASKLAYRLEPTGPNFTTELVERPLEQVICLNLPAPADQDTNGVAYTPPLYPDDFPNVPIPDYQNGIVVLQSLVGAIGVVYLDFNPGYTPTWGGITYDSWYWSNSKIRDIWRRVAEDFIPFNINVTTDLKVFQNAPETSRQRVICTPTKTAAPGSGGVAYYNSWNWSGDTPCWVFNSGTKSCAEACSHEVGHTLGLSHDGTTNGVTYYVGQGSGLVAWAPIMGNSYSGNVSHWCHGEYATANNQEDQLAMITSQNNNVAYRADDTGDTLATARYLELYSDYTAAAQGVIERAGDTDAFRFTTSGGAVSLQVHPCNDNTWANLAAMATLCDASDTVIASDNPQDTLGASISTNLPAGSYTFRVTGTGRNDPFIDGFSNYASLGYYSIAGTVAGARLPNRFSIPENSTNGTFVGVVPPINPGSDPLVYAISSGNTSNTFALNNAGNLTVANNALLNYETLAANTQLPVQFEMFVNITDTLNPALTETNRRVVVAITDVNEPPVVTTFSTNLLEHSTPGLVIGQVTAADQDFGTLLTYSFASGNSNGMFSIGSQSGAVTLLGDLIAAQQRIYNLAVAVSDQILIVTSTVTVTVITNQTPFPPGSVNYAVYTSLAGNVMSGLTNAASFPLAPAFEKTMPSFEGDTDWNDNYGAVMRGYLIPPVTGSYRLYIASDDNGELWLSSSTNPASMSRIASVSGDGNWTSPRQWNKFSTQRSASQSLTAGRGYYIEARMKEGSGGDNLSVGWSGPSLSGTNVIPGMYLAPYSLNYIPQVSSRPYNLHRDAFTGSRLDLLTVTDVNTNDAHAFAILSGNTNGLFAINPTNGLILVADQALLLATAQTNHSLQIRVTDNGSPARANTNTVAITLVPTNAITVIAIQQEIWTNGGSGTAVSDLTTNSDYPKRPDLLYPLAAWDGAQNFDDNYGSRIRAFLTPTSTGAYTFYIASDDSSHLLFSNGTNPVSASVIASVTGSTGIQEWTNSVSQQSAPVSLVAGQRYYLESRHKEGSGDDLIQVGWIGPGLSNITIIDGSFLTPVDLNYAPDLSTNSLSTYGFSTNGASVGAFAALDSTLDRLTYRIVSGNTSNTFALDPATGLLTVSNNSLLPALIGSAINLVVQAQDSGYDGLYPLKIAQATVKVSVLSTNGPYRFEGETVPVDLADAGVTWSAQNMSAYGTGWSGNAQLGGDFGGSTNFITLGLQLYGTGRFWLDVYVTKGPAYGIFNWYLDGALVGSALDGYASSIRTNPRIRIGSYYLASGRHQLKLKCAGKNTSSAGYGFGLDYVELTNYKLPTFALQPHGQTVLTGSDVVFDIIATGDGLLYYQWCKDALPISAATSPELSLYSVGRPQAGDYTMVVTNLGGGVTSSVANLRVLVPQRLQLPQTLADGRVQFLFGDYDGAALAASDAASFVVQAATNLASPDWQPVPASPVLTNGKFLFIDAAATNYPSRFYRVLEQ